MVGNVEPGSLVLGLPARVVRWVGPRERDQIIDGAQHYVDLLDLHRAGVHRDR
ncbi:hypothetical protein [Saccharomonospora sp.]|uniref:hypothetical protein n=1 Tax=Saccharomonospora sp. TaxID=33913 RepID=UPI00262F3FD0|nr:hypothetical protein [Saccharomonospora sp.]